MDQIEKSIIKFRDERDWKQFHSEKDLAISISLEANDLLEIFQWKTSNEALKDMDHIKEELADVFIYAYMMANQLDVNVKDIIEDKLEKNRIKYPVDKSKGTDFFKRK